MKKVLIHLIAGIVLTLSASLGAVAASGSPYIVATDAPWAPFEMVTSQGEFFGFDLDLITAIAHISGFEIEIQNIAFDAIIENIRTGRVDIGASGLTITPERDAVVDFSVPYYLSNQAVVVSASSGVNLATALAGLGPNGKLGAQNGSTGLWWVEDNIQGAGIDVELSGYETYPAAILDLVNGRIDAVMQDEPASQASLAAYPGELAVAGVIHTNEAFGFVVQDGDPNGLLALIDSALTQLGLETSTLPGGGVVLSAESGSFASGLMQIYFGPAPADIEAAWNESKSLLQSGDLDGYIDSMLAKLY